MKMKILCGSSGFLEAGVARWIFLTSVFTLQHTWKINKFAFYNNQLLFVYIMTKADKIKAVELKTYSRK